MSSDLFLHDGSFYGDYLWTDQEVACADLLESLEPALMRVSELAVAMQGQVEVEHKTETGNLRADVVTAADRRVQHELLVLLSSTDLRSCRLLTEEEESSHGPDLRRCFDPEGKLYLTIDPIDGTKRFTEGRAWFSTIIGLHNGVRPLYTFVYYPALRWWIRLRGETATMSAPSPPEPELEAVPGDLRSTVVYTAGDPRAEIPSLVKRLEETGTRFTHSDEVGPWGSKYLLLTGQAGGYYTSNPNLYDGLFGLHYGLCSGAEIVAHGRRDDGRLGGALDLTRIRQGPHGGYYPGFYLVSPRSED